MKFHNNTHRAMRFAVCALLIGGGAAAVGCVGVDPNQACLDLADARADVAERCGLDYDNYYQGYLASAAGGDCNNVKEIRDEDELYQQCLPRLDDLTCEQFENDTGVDKCKEQLIR